MNKDPLGIGFVGCELLSPASAVGRRTSNLAPHSHGRRREVVINGTRVKTVDVHAHCAVPEAMGVIDQHCVVPELLMTDTATRIGAMDEQGIDVSALSINPYWYHAERDSAAELIKIQNQALVELCAATPIALSPLPPRHCNTRILRFSRSSTLPKPSAFEASGSAAALRVTNLPTRSFIHSGRSARS